MSARLPGLRRALLGLTVALAACAAIITSMGTGEPRGPRSVASRERPPRAKQDATIEARVHPPTPTVQTRNETRASTGPTLPRETPRAPSHPTTPEHARIQHELGLIRQLSDAYDRQDSAAMRVLLAEYRHVHQDDPHAMQAGYEILADCIEDPEAARAEAQQYYTVERASTLRRLIRRSCLELD